jgi:hypothetical protein
VLLGKAEIVERCVRRVLDLELVRSIVEERLGDLLDFACALVAASRESDRGRRWPAPARRPVARSAATAWRARAASPSARVRLRRRPASAVRTPRSAARSSRRRAALSSRSTRAGGRRSGGRPPSRQVENACGALA